MKPKLLTETLKLCSGIIIGLVTAFLLWKIWPDTKAALIAAALGIHCIILWAILRSKKTTNKIISCILVSAMTVSPNVLADTYAGFNGKTCYCLESASNTTPPPTEPHVVVLEFILDPDPGSQSGNVIPRIISVRHPSPETLVSYDEMNASLITEWGIDLDGGQQFSRNGRPAFPEEVPFVFGQDWEQSFTLYPSQPQYRVVVEVATELGEFANWQSLAHFSIPANTRITVQDTPEGAQAFYRVRAERPPEMFQPAGPILLGCGLGLLGGAAVVGVLAVRACARRKKKFEKMMPGTNAPTVMHFDLPAAR